MRSLVFLSDEEHQEHQDLEHGRSLLGRRAGALPRGFGSWLLGATAIVACCGLAAWAWAPKTVSVINGNDSISLAQRPSKTLMEELEDPQCSDFKQLQFLSVVHNNLANMGPGMGREGIEYHVRTSDGKDMYMDVNALSAFHSSDVKDFGMHGAYATLNVGGDDVARLIVTFRDYITKEKVWMEDFSLSFFDIDMGKGGEGVEALTIRGDWSMAVVAKDTTVLVHHTEEDERRITFQGTNVSAPEDQPANPNVLTLNQYNKAVTIRFQHADEFHMSLHVRSKTQISRVFEFIGQASILCATSPNKGEHLPIGQVYVNESQIKELGASNTNWWWVLAGLLFGICIAALLIPFCCPKQKEYVEVPPPPKQGPGIFVASFAAGPGARLGLHLDSPEGLNFYPMIKKILVGAVQTFNQEGKPNAIDPHDMIVGVGDVTDPALILGELKKGLPVETKLTLDRPHKIQAVLHGDLGLKLDALEDSYGAVIMDIQPTGSVAKYNADNPKMKVNRGDRIVSVNGNTFDPKSGWTIPKSGDASKKSSSPFGSRSNSRFLEEIQNFKDQDIEVTMLKYTTYDK